MGRKKIFDHDHPNPFGVKPGQIWENLDPRFEARRIKVLMVKEDMGYAVVERQHSKRMGQVLLKRFRPMTNGYKLVRDA